MRQNVTAMVLAISALAAGCGSDTIGEESPADSGADETSSLPRLFPALAVVDERVVVWGGSAPPTTDADFINSGVIIDPRTQDRQKIASPPWPNPLRYPTATTIGNGVFVIGVSCSAESPKSDGGGLTLQRCAPGGIVAGLYNVVTDAWQPVELPAELDRLEPVDENGLVTYPTAVAVGAVDSKIVLEAGAETGTFWTYEVTSGAWGPLPSPPAAPGAGFDPCVSGNRLVIAESAAPLPPSGAIGGGPSTQGVILHVLEFAGASPSWVSSPQPSEVAEVRPTFLRCSPVGVVVNHLPESDNWFFDPTTYTWKRLPLLPGEVLDSPMPFPLYQGLWSGREFLFGSASFEYGLALNPGTLRWRLTEPWPVDSQTSIGVDGTALLTSEGGSLGRPDETGEIRVFVP